MALTLDARPYALTAHLQFDRSTRISNRSRTERSRLVCSANDGVQRAADASLDQQAYREFALSRRDLLASSGLALIGARSVDHGQLLPPAPGR